MNEFVNPCEALLTRDDQHRYWHVGQRLVGVSQLIKDWRDEDYGHVASSVVQKAAERGTAVHDIAQRHDETGDAEAIVTGDTVNDLVSYQKFRKHTCFEPVVWGLQLFHPELRYAGEIDVVGELPNGRLLLDLKRRVRIDRASYLQLLLYKKLWDRWFPQWPIHQTALLHLRGKTTGKLLLNPLEANEDAWVSAVLWRHHWQTGGK